MKITVVGENLWQKTKRAVKTGWEGTKRFVKENPELSIGIVTVGVPAVLGFGKKAIGAVEQHRELHRHEHEVWDPSAQIWYHTRKPLSGHRAVEYARRVANGENRAEILNDMRML